MLPGLSFPGWYKVLPLRGALTVPRHFPRELISEAIARNVKPSYTAASSALISSRRRDSNVLRQCQFGLLSRIKRTSANCSRLESLWHAMLCRRRPDLSVMIPQSLLPLPATLRMRARHLTACSRNSWHARANQIFESGTLDYSH
jgi:hypothetical protein